MKHAFVLLADYAHYLPVLAAAHLAKSCRYMCIWVAAQLQGGNLEMFADDSLAVLPAAAAALRLRHCTIAGEVSTAAGLSSRACMVTAQRLPPSSCHLCKMTFDVLQWL